MKLRQRFAGVGGEVSRKTSAIIAAARPLIVAQLDLARGKDLNQSSNSPTLNADKGLTPPTALAKKYSWQLDCPSYNKSTPLGAVSKTRKFKHCHGA